MNRQERQAVIKRHPRISYKSDKVQCEGYTWSRMPMKALWNKDGSRADGTLQEQYRCKNNGHWKFRALRSKNSMFDAKDGLYCWSHLMTQVFTYTESDAFYRWLDRQPEVLAEAARLEAIRQETEAIFSGASSQEQ